eukprot:TRINITY_DN9230_c0_g2_i1.p1 TRINITY_DN9230_c0_g2~~TRINITY_DN9230_c0_g2_i1.p1  ORF type:complete len:264 (+),score=42.27 TRINITY_DN9230_c0_g2_i1:45-794(+)
MVALLLGAALWFSCLCVAVLAAGFDPATMSQVPPPGYKPVGQETEEEHFSSAMPDSPGLKCDSCLISAQVWVARFQRQQQKKSRYLKETEYYPEMDRTCRGMSEYGMTHVEGGSRFGGPGTFATTTDSGDISLKQTDLWRARIQRACLGLIDEFDGETEIYQAYLKALKEVGDNDPSYLFPQAPSKFEAVTKFVKKLCKAGKKTSKKKATGRTSNKVKKTCTEDLFYFTREGYEAVQKQLDHYRARVEL